MIYLKKLNSIAVLNKRFFQSFTNSVDQNEIHNFNQISDWWNPAGQMSALWSYNQARIEFLRKILSEQKNVSRYNPVLFNQINSLDIGCGGGLLTESLSRLGCQNVLGIDACLNSIQVAQNHQKLDASLNNLSYRHTTIEEYLQEQQKGQNINNFELVTCMEVIEHVLNKENFISNISQLLKPQGILFMSTMEKTPISWFKMIFAAEYLFRFVPRGTHDWNKFINSEKLADLIQKNNFTIINIQGVQFNPINSTFSNSNDKMQYFIAAIKN